VAFIGAAFFTAGTVPLTPYLFAKERLWIKTFGPCSTEEKNTAMS
jgi:hypothetical protein